MCTLVTGVQTCALPISCRPVEAKGPVMGRISPIFTVSWAIASRAASPGRRRSSGSGYQTALLLPARPRAGRDPARRAIEGTLSAASRKRNLAKHHIASGKHEEHPNRATVDASPAGPTPQTCATRYDGNRVEDKKFRQEK